MYGLKYAKKSSIKINLVLKGLNPLIYYTCSLKNTHTKHIGRSSFYRNPPIKIIKKLGALENSSDDHKEMGSCAIVDNTIVNDVPEIS